MTEQTVRDAVRVADELVDITKYPQGEGLRMWERVFDALIAPDPWWPGPNMTATGAELTRLNEEVKGTTVEAQGDE